MLHEVEEAFGNLNGKVLVDCTLGGAGHSAVLEKNGAQIIGIDQDIRALEAAKKRLANPVLVNDNFGNLDKILLDLNIPGIDAVLMDLGLSSAQIDVISRGFSFKENSPLDMRMNPEQQTLNAAKIVNSYGTDDLIRVLRNFSEEKFAKEIAQEIVKVRKTKEIKTSEELVDIIKAAIPAPARRRGGHPAKRTFQALRIEVNEELKMLKQGLDAAIRWLNSGGKIVVISYHSLEDKIVKNTFKSMVNRCTCPPDLPTCVCNKKPILKILTKSALTPTNAEIENNSRSRSAKLRVAEKI